MTKKLMFKEWLLFKKGISFGQYMKRNGKFKDKCRKEYAEYRLEVTGGEKYA